MSIRITESFAKGDWSANQNSFFDGYRSGTVIHDSVTNRIWQNSVEISLQFLPNDTILLFELKAITIGQGNGGKALDWLVDLARINDMKLTLSVFPFDETENNPLSDKSVLEAWYSKRGFVHDKSQQANTNAMILYP